MDGHLSPAADPPSLPVVRIRRAVSGTVNGVRLGHLRVEQLYAVAPAVAWYLVAIDAAVIVRPGEKTAHGAGEDGPAQVVPFARHPPRRRNGDGPD